MLIALALAALADPQTGPTCAGPLDWGIDEPRPNLSGEVLTYDFGGGAFRLHWTLDGEDAPALDADGVPLLLPIVEEAILSSREALVGRGWRGLAADDGTGGSDGIDLYLVDIDANGYANALTPAVGEDGASCFIRLDPGISGFGADVAASIATHELAHCFQYRYSTTADAWVYEASATYEQFRESASVPALSVPLGLLWAQRLGQPDRPLYETGDRFEYAGFVWFKFLEESEAAAPPQVWEAVETDARWESAHRALLADVGLGPRFAEFATYNAFACARATGGGYDPAANAHCTAPGASVPVVELALDDSGAGELDVGTLAPWTSTTVVIPAYSGPLEGNETVDAIAATCSVGSGEVRATLADAAMLTGFAEGGALQDQVFDVELALANPDAQAVLTLASVGEGPAELRCQVRWLFAEGGCGCTAAPLGGLSPFILFLPWLIRRRSC